MLSAAGMGKKGGPNSGYAVFLLQRAYPDPSRSFGNRLFCSTKSTGECFFARNGRRKRTWYGRISLESRQLGVKWDIYVDKIDRETLGWTEGCDRIEVGFDTAWSMPERWFATASELFPQLSFKLHFEEPGCYFAGDMLGENGVVSTEYYNDEKLREIFAWTEA